MMNNHADLKTLEFRKLNKAYYKVLYGRYRTYSGRFLPDCDISRNFDNIQNSYDLLFIRERENYYSVKYCKQSFYRSKLKWELKYKFGRC